ncbi:E3 ubiquitin-protein ligase Mdm2 isoform X1 [Anguilla anguilla]|uniref:E3 ubiquitin-protein ligase Mdm2 isoform X1 n=2 Tax=Anguilla anguilla TaxID=7936 RepID=UPI0015AD2B6D|nr:E3 ubiquitin-protein ligase Mdm2 isoform X1 [Anguilla anguilla]
MPGHIRHMNSECVAASPPLGNRMAMDNSLSSSQMNAVDSEKLVRPKVELQTLLQHAGASKDIFTLKEVMFYLGQYIMSKQLYDKKQQHIVHCANDALGAVLGVDSFSVKEPRILYAMISKNLTAVKNQDSQSAFTEPRSQSEPDRGPEETDLDSHSSTSGRRRRRCSDPAGCSTEEDASERRKRHKSDSFSLTFDDSLSWCVIGGLRRDRGSSESSDSRSDAEVGVSGCEDSDESLSQDSDCDNFSVEFEVESIDSDDYSEHDEASVASGEEQLYEVTIFEAEDEDSFDEDTEISEADYWKCSKCEELNPPLPRHCNRCWTLRQDWLPETSPKALPPKPPTTGGDAEEGLDVPDGKRARSPPAAGEHKEDSACESQEPSSQPSTSGVSSAPSSQDEVPELERFNSLEACLPASCLEPCVICQSRPKNGCIVHGRTGHLMACYTCAKKLKNRNKLCPVCREPIQSVVLTYLS